MSNEPTTTATLYYDANSCMSWLEFLHQPDDATRAELYSAGWRWRRYREAYSTNARFPQFPKGVQIRMGGEVTYSAERAERLEERADKHSAEAERRYAASSRIADGIPLGQPILVGHHSEKRHRRDLARIDAHMRQSVEHQEQAKHLEEQAEGSARHQHHMQAPRLIFERLASFRADLVHLQQQATSYDPEQHVTLVASVEQRIAIEERRLADAGGYTPPTAESVGVQPGDIVQLRIFSWPHLVKRVNSKSLSVVYQDGERRHSGTAAFKDVKRILSRCPAGKKPCLTCEWGSIWVDARDEQGHRLLGGHRETCGKCGGTGYVSVNK